MLDGYRKVDPATRKKLPVQSDVLELLVEMVYQQGKNQPQRATADLTMVAFYYLLRVGEYTVKRSSNSSTKYSLSSKRTTVESSDASRGMLLRISSHLPMGPH
jgi:hypothetical protein